MGPLRGYFMGLSDKQCTTEVPDGVWVVMITPFDKSGQIDMGAYAGLVDYYIDNNVAGLFTCCGSSEILEMSRAEILDVTHHVIDCTAGRLPVISGAIVYDGDVKSKADFARQIWDLGADVVMITPNQFVGPDDSDELLDERLREFVEAVGDDVVLGTYEFPMPFVRRLPLATYKWMAESGRFVCHKDTSCDIDEIGAKIKLSQGTRLKFFNANLQTLLASFRLGGNGYCGTGTNYCPELYVWFWDNFLKHPERAEDLQQYLNNFENQVDWGQNYPASAKAYMGLRGIEITPRCRMRLKSVTDEQVRQLQGVLDGANQYHQVLAAAGGQEVMVKKPGRKRGVKL